MSATLIRPSSDTRTSVTTRAVIIQKGEHVSAGPLAALLEERGLAADAVRVDRGDALPDPAGLAVAVLLGANELTDELDPRVIRWIQRADAHGVAIFAVGTGAHALAVAFGGSSEPARRAERGWISVTSADPELLASGGWFAWNDRSLKLPADAVVIARSASGPQAFRIGRHLAVQFHPEATPELVREWVPVSRELLDFQGIHEATVRDFPAARRAAERLLTGFVDGALAA